MTKYDQLKMLFNSDDDVTHLYNYLQAVSILSESCNITLIITPNISSSKRVFQKLLSEFECSDFEIARYVRDGSGFEFILTNHERIMIQDIDYVMKKQRDGLRFKKILFME